MNPLCPQIDETSSPEEGRLPSGRSVRLRVAGGTEELEIRSPEGDVEVRIVLTDGGPVVQLRAARLELDSADTVAVRCRRLELQASEHLQMDSGGEVRVSGKELNAKTEGDIRLEGDVIHLN